MTTSYKTKQPHQYLSGFSNFAVLTAIALLALLATTLFLLNRSSGGAATPSPPSQEQIEQALIVLQQDFQTALQEEQNLSRLAAQAQAFTEDHPDQQSGFVLLAQIRMSLEQWPDAYAAWDHALGIDDSGFELSKMAGLCAAKLGELDTALAHYQQAVAATHDQADYEVYAALGRLHLSLGDTDAAETMFQRAVEARGPGEEANYKHQALAGLADVAAVRQDFDQAFDLVDRAIKMADIDSTADPAAYHIQKARLYMDAGQDEDATSWLGYTWSQYPDALWRIESARLRAKLYERAGDLERAVDYIQSITERHRRVETRDDLTLAIFTALLAEWQVKANRLDDARISLHNLQTLAPKHPAIDGLKQQLR